jgi:signal transduction histidine kinase
VRERTSELAAANTQLQSEVETRKDAEARAESASRAKSAFLANLSHEIRTPMNAVLGYAQILARDPALTPQHRESVASIRHSGEHLLGVLNDILDLSKIEAGRMQLRATGFSLTACLQAVAAMFRAKADEKNLRLLLDHPAGEFHVLGDEGKLRQVLINLVGNAIKFTDTGTVTISVSHAAGDNFTFSVRDTGPGIRAEDQRLIFEPFLQSETTITPGGTGLGLAIARQHVRLMGGTLQLDSTPGKGAHFHFVLRLPLTESVSINEQTLGTQAFREAQANASIPPSTSASTEPSIPIDPTLYDALLTAVDLFSVTHFRTALDKLAHDSPKHAQLVTRLSARLRRCDFPAIRQLLANHAPLEPAQTAVEKS